MSFGDIFEDIIIVPPVIRKMQIRNIKESDKINKFIPKNYLIHILGQI
jgi:hypothetical protein